MTTILIIILAVIIIRYAAKKATADPDEQEARHEHTPFERLHFNRFKTYYTDRSFRAYELYPAGIKFVDEVMQSFTPRLPEGAFSTKSRTRDFRLVGGQHHGTEPWQLIYGKCKPEEGNQYDPNAVAVYSISSKLLGYLSRDDAARYREEFGNDPHWCWGFTYQTSKGNVAAKLTCLGELFDSPKGQKTPIVDLVRNGLISDYGEMSYFKDHRHTAENQ